MLQFLNGSRSEGSFSVFATLIPKFVAIPASALPLAVVNLLGFEPPIDGVAQEQTGSVKIFIRMTFVLLPLLAATGGFIIKIFFPIKTAKILGQIQDGIAKHERYCCHWSVGLPVFSLLVCWDGCVFCLLKLLFVGLVWNRCQFGTACLLECESWLTVESSLCLGYAAVLCIAGFHVPSSLSRVPLLCVLMKGPLAMSVIGIVDLHVSQNLHAAPQWTD